jgi:ATP-dependent DNA helicase DinG
MSDRFPDWRAHFPLATPRAEQARALDFAVEALYSGMEDVLLELPTGVGKSAIAVALGGVMAANSRTSESDVKLGATVLTSQKILQDQYERDFPTRVVDLRSSSNYRCSKGRTCGEQMRLSQMGSKKRRDCMDVCPYKSAKEAFLARAIGVTNYSFLISEAVYAGTIPKRELLVLDEAHNVEDEVRRWATISITKKFCKEELELDLPWMKEDKRLHEFFLTKYVPGLQNRKKKLEILLLEELGDEEHDEVPTYLKKAIASYESIDKILCQANRLVNGTVDRAEYVVGRGDGVYELKPLDVSKQAHEVLLSRGLQRVHMSATIGSFPAYMRSLGLSQKTTRSLSVPSPFPSSAYGIQYMPIGSMAARFLKEPQNQETICLAVSAILEGHLEQKGIVHTVSFELASIVGQIGDPRLIVHQPGDDRDELLERHKASKEPTVLVSPSMMEGVDLRGDLARFSIVLKVPYPYMGDPVVERKLKDDPEWYNARTVRSLVQSMGRSVRDHEDWATTYVLDQAIVHLRRKAGGMMPKFLVDAIDGK